MVLSPLPRHAFCRLFTNGLCSVRLKSSSDMIVKTEKRYEDMRRYLPGQFILHDIDGTDLGTVNPLDAVRIAEKKNMVCYLASFGIFMVKSLF